MNIQKVNESGEAILKALSFYTSGWKNEEALREITKLADAALYASEHDAYVADQVFEVKSWAEILYSQRRHKRWGGPERVRDFVYSSAYHLASWGGKLEMPSL